MGDNLDFWSEDIEVVESKGMLDVQHAYTWELTERTLRRGVIFSLDAPQDTRGKQLSDLDVDERKSISPRWVGDLIELKFDVVDEEQSVQLRESAWVSNTLTLNTDNPQYQSRLATLIQKLGGELEPETKIKLNDYIPVGIQFHAHPRAQKNKDGKDTGYHELDLSTITDVKKGKGAKTQSKVSATDFSDEDKAAVQDIIDGADAKTREGGIKALIEAKKTNLMNVLLAMEEAGEIKWT